MAAETGRNEVASVSPYGGGYVAAVVANDGGRCLGVGPSYWRTFDGLEFLFAGRCVYTLFSDGTCTVTVDMSACSTFANCRKVSRPTRCPVHWDVEAGCFLEKVGGGDFFFSGGELQSALILLFAHCTDSGKLILGK